MVHGLALARQSSGSGRDYATGIAGALDALVGTGMIISLIVGIAAFVACVVVAFTPMKQGLHDMIASTLVVKK